MNDFEGVETGKWLVREIGHLLYEAVCPVCGYRVPVLVDHDVMTFKYRLYGLHETCPGCHENMFQSELELSTNETGFTINTTDPNSNSIVISCERITLAQNSIGIELDISKNLETVEVIEINGIKFRRETI